MKSVKQYLEIVGRGLESLDLHREPDGLFAPIRYVLDGGGKRLRPVLTLAVAEAAGDVDGIALPAAIAIEVFHNFTLLHDDIMDKSSTRRGRQTVHVRWNEPTAILSGDTMLTFAMDILLGSKSERITELMKTFNRAAMDVYIGQQLDMDFEKRDDVSVEEYIAMITGKTSALIAGACVLGAISAGAGPDIVDCFRRYGNAVGIAFQLQDDLLDTFGDQVTFGKPIGGDILNDKKTWLMINAMTEAPARFGEIIASGLKGQQKIDAVKELYIDLKLHERCAEMIDRYTEDAVSEIYKADIVPESKSFFVDMACNLAGRRK